MRISSNKGYLIIGFICTITTILLTTIISTTLPIKTVIGSQRIVVGKSCMLVDGPGIYLYGVLIESEVLYKILECESKLDPSVCNKKYGCSSGIGLGQLTAIAIEDCENNLGVKIDPYNPQENLMCSLWLYEKYRTAPWGSEETEWGSFDCWKKVAIINS